jgi:hypothetical protein
VISEQRGLLLLLLPLLIHVHLTGSKHNFSWDIWCQDIRQVTRGDSVGQLRRAS